MMEVDILRSELAKHETYYNKQVQRMQTLREQITEGVKPLVKERLKVNVEKEVRGSPEHTKALGRESLSSMKQELAKLLEESGLMVDECFSDDSMWIHTNYSARRDTVVYNDKRKAEENIYAGIRRVLGEAGKLLLKYKYIKLGTVYQADGSRRTWSTDSNGQGRVAYRGELQTPKELDKLIADYTSAIEVLDREERQIASLRQRIAEQEASDLWDEA